MNSEKIKDLVLAITYNCNSKCRMCNIWKKSGQFEEMPADLIFSLPRNINEINITGGEPFLHTKIEEIVLNIKNHLPKARIIISTNGFATQLITEKIKKIIAINSNIGVAISIDGIGEEHEKIRGVQGGYEKVLQTINNLKSLGLKYIKIGFTLGNYNTGELKKVYELASKLNTEFSLAVLHSSENFFNKENIFIYNKEIEETLNWLIKKELSSWNLKKWARAYFAYGAKYFLKNNKRIIPDYSGENNIFIDPKGNIYSSDVSENIIGKIDNQNFYLEKTSLNIKNSWMICTARSAMKKHWFKVGKWIINNKFTLLNNILKLFDSGK